jgi:hypothetical protein
MSWNDLPSASIVSRDEGLVIETLDWFSEILLHRPWHSVGVVIALNVAVVAAWIAFEKRCDAKRPCARWLDEGRK